MRQLLGLPCSLAAATGLGVWGKLAGWFKGWRRRRGLRTTTHPRWENWVRDYTRVSHEELVERWRRAAEACKFIPPLSEESDDETA